MSADKVILGSDYPFPLGENQAGKMIKSMDELDQNTKEKILALNACEFLGVDPKDFQ